MNDPASTTVTPVFVADLHVEGERMPIQATRASTLALPSHVNTTSVPISGTLEPDAKNTPRWLTFLMYPDQPVPA